jgi:hypothetical protein
MSATARAVEDLRPDVGADEIEAALSFMRCTDRDSFRQLLEFYLSDGRRYADSPSGRLRLCWQDAAVVSALLSAKKDASQEDREKQTQAWLCSLAIELELGLRRERLDDASAGLPWGTA